MTSNQGQSYQDMFTVQLKSCKSKKDYKRLCKQMIKQFEVIDRVEENQWRVFASTIGPDAYIEGMTLALEMYVLEQQGIPCDIVSICDRRGNKMG